CFSDLSQPCRLCLLSGVVPALYVVYAAMVRPDVGQTTDRIFYVDRGGWYILFLYPCCLGLYTTGSRCVWTYQVPINASCYSTCPGCRHTDHRLDGVCNSLSRVFACL